MNCFVAPSTFNTPIENNLTISIMGPKHIGVTALFERILFEDAFTFDQIPSVSANIRENICFPSSQRHYNLYAEKYTMFEHIEAWTDNKWQDDVSPSEKAFRTIDNMGAFLVLFQEEQSKGSWERAAATAMKMRQRYGSTKRIYAVETMCDITRCGQYHVSPFEMQLFDDIFHVSAYKDIGIREMLIQINHDTRRKKPTKSAAFTKL